MKRIEIHSHNPRVNVYLSSVSIDKNKSYKLAIEKLSVPAIESRVLNTPLFEVERRQRVPPIMTNIRAHPEHRQLGIPEQYRVFTPRDVRSLTHLLFQMDGFFREFQLRMVVAPDAAFADLDVFGVYDDVLAEYTREGNATFDEQLGADWYALGQVHEWETTGRVVRVVCRSDGRIGFKFGVDFQKLFVLRFTDEGARIFNVKTNRGYIAIDPAGNWNRDYYIDAHGGFPVDEIAYNLPAAAALQDEIYYTDSVFPFVDHRSEMVVQCSLPLSQTGEGTEQEGKYKRQLVSYRFPEYRTKMSTGVNGSVLHRAISEVREHTFEFETNLATHNKFILTGTDLQNFNILLVHRVHTYKDGKFVVSETPYEMPDQSTFVLRFAVRQV